MTKPYTRVHFRRESRLLLASSSLCAGWWKKVVKREMSLPRLWIGGGAEPETVISTMFIDNDKSGKSSELPLFSFDCISKATGKFSESNKLGEGGFGHVYKVVCITHYLYNIHYGYSSTSHLLGC